MLGVRPMRGMQLLLPLGAPVRLNHLEDGLVAEGDPLPPEDRVRSVRSRILDTIYRAYGERLVRSISRRVCEDRAQEIVQQIFCRLARLSDAEQRNIAAPGPYLRRAASNVLRDDARQAERRSTHLHLCDEEVTLTSGDELARLEARDALRRLENALARLKPRTQEIFLAHRIDGYSYAEIAQRTGLSIKTVEMHMTRAIAYLARHRDA